MLLKSKGGRHLFFRRKTILVCALFVLHVIALHAVIHLVRLSEGKELPRFQHFRSTKTSIKFLNAWGKIISAETLLDENNLCGLHVWKGYIYKS